MEQQLVKIWVKVKAGSTSQYEEHLQPFRKNFIVIGKKPVIDTKPLYDEQSISPVPLSRSIQHSHSLATGGTLDYILFSRSHVQPTIIIYEVVFQIRPKSARRLFSSFIGSHRIFCDIYITVDPIGRIHETGIMRHGPGVSLWSRERKKFEREILEGRSRWSP